MKTTRPRTGLKLVPVMFRLSEHHIARLDKIAAELSRRDRSPRSRTDALRHCINAYTGEV